MIRSLTVGLPWERLGPENWTNVERLLAQAERMCARKSVHIRTRRLVLPPVTDGMGMNAAHLRAVVESVRKRGDDCSIRWYCLPISASDAWQGDNLCRIGPSLIMDEPSFFLHYMCGGGRMPDMGTLSELGEHVMAVSRISNNGFDNFRVGTGFNVPANTPFFPFSWHEGAQCFSFAVESLHPLIVALEHGERNLREVLSTICSSIDEVGIALEEACEGRFEYRGLDISLAPYPNDTDSVALLMEKLGLDAFGASGTTSATYFLTRLLKSAVSESGARHVGFNGVMFSPLEDRGMARTMRQRCIGLDSFMAWSTVCGCGVDMVPVPGNVSPRSIGALYADVAALSDKHGKPLGVRILPIPGGRVNQLTEFNHDFLANCPVVDLGGGLIEELGEHI